MSETDFLKLKKHDNVETNTEKFDIENYLNGNWDKINENAKEVNTNISNINSKDTELEKELKEAQEDFYQNSIRGQASGEYIHVEDSSNCRAKVGISGNSEQETRTQGRNYFTGNKIEGGSNLGVTYSFDNSILKLNGTTTNKGNILEKISTKVILTSGNYKFRAGLYAGSFERNSKDMAIYLSNKEDFVTGAYVSSGITLSSLGSVGSFTITENTELYVSIFVNDAGLVLNNTQLAILIAKAEKDENIGTFEQFTPDMPSPDYQSPVKTVGSNVNIFDKDNYIKSKLYINKNENKFSEASMGKSFIFDISKYNKLTISKVLSERFGVFASVDYPQKDGVGTYLQDAATNATSFSYDFAKFNYLVVFYYFTSDTLTEQEILDSIKIVEGTEVGEYSKHGQGCVKVTKCNENILDTSTTKKVKNQSGEERTGYFCKITKTGKYYLMLNTANTLYFGKSTDLNNATTLIGSTSLTFSTTYDFNEGEYFILWGTKTDTDKIMVILSDKQQEYIEHQEQSYIMPVQQEMLEDDYFDFDNEEEVHTWGKTVLTGEEVWYTNINSGWNQNSHVFALPFLGVETNGQSTNVGNVLKSNNFKCTNTGDLVWKPRNYISYYPAYRGGSIMINHQGVTTLTDFKAWLKTQYDAGTPVIIYYMLATPTRLKFTDDQKAVVKELNNARTYKNVTNITTDSIAILSLDYAKDLETLLTSKESEV